MSTMIVHCILQRTLHAERGNCKDPSAIPRTSAPIEYQNRRISKTKNVHLFNKESLCVPERHKTISAVTIFFLWCLPLGNVKMTVGAAPKPNAKFGRTHRLLAVLHESSGPDAISGLERTIMAANDRRSDHMAHEFRVRRCWGITNHRKRGSKSG